MFSSDLWHQSGVSVYSIDQSIRFNDGDSAYMHKTPGSAGNQKTHTLSWWIKRSSNLGAYQTIFSARTGSGGATNYAISFTDADKIEFYLGNGSVVDGGLTNMVFRDVSAWYHIVLAIDTTQGTASNRFKVYVNGSQVTTDGSYGDLAQNTDYNWNSSREHSIGRQNYNNNAYIDAYMTEINFVDGTALDPSSFGETNDNGIWIPKEYTGSYGTNGYFIDGRDASDLGDDESGNGNDYTTSGLAAADQFLDSPTNLFTTFNSLSNRLKTFSNGNLEAVAASATTAHKTTKSTLGIPPSSTGKFYHEIQVPGSTGSGDVDIIGYADLEDGSNTESSTVNSGSGYGIGYKIGTGDEYLGAGWTDNSFTFAGFVANNYYGFAYDASTGKLYIYQNGSALNSGAHVATFDKRSTIGPGFSCYNNTNTYKLFNGGQTSLSNDNFNYAPPTGYVPINSTNIGAS